MDVATRTNLVKLKGKIKGLAEEVRRGRLHLKTLPNSAEEGWLTRKWCSRALTRNLGVEIRSYLLAYGLLRGIPYSFMEPKRGTKPNAKAILKIIHDHLPNYEVDKWTLEMIESMLDVETEEETSASET